MSILIGGQTVPKAIYVGSKKGKVKRLSVSKNETYSGETSALFKDSKPFTFLGI